jgi:hypothetical protein
MAKDSGLGLVDLLAGLGYLVGGRLVLAASLPCFVPALKCDSRPIGKVSAGAAVLGADEVVSLFGCEWQFG